MDDDGYWEDLLPWGQAAPACALSLVKYAERYLGEDGRIYRYYQGFWSGWQVWVPDSFRSID